MISRGQTISRGQMITRGRVGLTPRLFAGFLMATMLVVVLSFGGAAESQLTIAVMPFNFSGGQWSGVDVGQQISNLVTDNLVNQGEFFVVERDLIQKIISEQDFGQSGRVDPSRAPEIGKLLGADVLLFGTVTRFEFSSGGGISAFGISLSSTSATVELTGRIVDTTQGVVRGSFDAQGKASGLGINVSDLQGISFNASKFQESALGEATRKAIDDLVANATRVINRHADDIMAEKSRQALEGIIVAVIEGAVILNIGDNDGVRIQQGFQVYRLLEVEGLADPVRIPVGTIRVISVDPGASVAVFEDLTQNPTVGDRVAAIQ